jgi:hypothetical protein
MPALADDEVVVDGDAEALARLDDRAGDIDIGAARRGVAARVVVEQRIRGG